MLLNPSSSGLAAQRSFLRAWLQPCASSGGSSGQLQRPEHAASLLDFRSIQSLGLGVQTMVNTQQALIKSTAAPIASSSQTSNCSRSVRCYASCRSGQHRVLIQLRKIAGKASAAKSAGRASADSQHEPALEHASSSSSSPKTADSNMQQLEIIPSESITSTANATVKHWVKLRESARYRRECGSLLLSSAELLQEAQGASSQPLCIKSLILLEGQPASSAAKTSQRNASKVSEIGQPAAKPTGAAAAGTDRELLRLPLMELLDGTRVVAVTEAVMKKVTGLESVAGVGAVAELPLPPWANFTPASSTPGIIHQHKASLTSKPASSSSSSEEGEQAMPPRVHIAARRLLVLDGVQDPGNLGTLVRSALAFGWDGALLLPGCCDPFNEKAIRASRGAVLRLPMAQGTLDQLTALAADGSFSLLCADLEDEPSAAAAAAATANGTMTHGSVQGVCLVLGSEGQGLSPAVRAACTPVAIPMPGRMESLNVGVAGSILMLLLGSDQQGVHALQTRLSELAPSPPLSYCS